MLLNIKRYFSNLFLDFKRICAENKLVLIALCSSLFLGLLLSINIGNKEVEFQGNIIILIKTTSFNVFWYLLKCAIYFAAVYAFVVLARLHFLAFIGNFVVLLIFFRIVFKAMILSLMFDGAYSAIYFLFYWLPLLIFSLLCYFYLCCKVYFTLGYSRCKRRPLCCPPGKVYFNLILRYFAINIVPFLIYNILFVIVFNLIF